jgi:hypothetical protein
MLADLGLLDLISILTVMVVVWFGVVLPSADES